MTHEKINSNVDSPDYKVQAKVEAAGFARRYLSTKAFEVRDPARSANILATALG